MSFISQLRAKSRPCDLILTLDNIYIQKKLSMRIALFRTFQTYTVSQQYLVFNDILNPITNGGGVFRTQSNFVAFRDPRKDEYIDMFHADFSYLSIY